MGGCAVAIAPPVHSLLRMPRFPKALLRYVGIWLAAGVLAVGVTRWGFTAGSQTDAVQLGVLIALTTVAEAVLLYLHHGRSREFVSLVETAIALNILLLPAGDAIGVTLAGVLIASVIHRRHVLKIIFNLSQYAVGTGAAIGVFHALAPAAGELGVQTAAALMAGMIVFGGVNAVAMAGIVGVLENRPFLKALTEGARITALTVLGNTSVGVLAAVVWGARPELAPLLAAPILTMHLAYRGVVRTHELLETVTAERDRLSRIINGSSNGIALLDADGNVDVWNPALAALTGVSADEARNQPVRDLLAPTDDSGQVIDLAAPVQAAAPDASASVIEMTVSHREGGEKIVKARHSLLFNNEEECVGDVILFDDITRQRESERLKDDFLARVSHELRTPLTPIKGYAQTMLRRSGSMSPDKQHEVLAMIVERVEHMELLIDDLLLVSQAVGGDSAGLSDDVRQVPVPLGDVCEKVVRCVRTNEPNRVFDVFGDTGAQALADPVRVAQIVATLLGNACKFSDATSSIEVELSSDENAAYVSVTDHGRGIPADHLERIFERFHRVEDPLRMETGGMGLGLFISRNLARAMGGDIDVSSRLGEGATFRLRLPLPSEDRAVA